MNEAELRFKIVAETASWIGTAFHHRGTIKAKKDATGKIVERGGVDCAQSIYRIYRSAMPNMIPEVMPTVESDYKFQWNLSKQSATDEPYLKTVLDLATEIDIKDVTVGDLVLFRVAFAYAHGVVVMPPGWPTVAHANSELGVFMLDRADQGFLKDRKLRAFTFRKPRI